MRRAAITSIAVLGITAGMTAATVDVIAAYLWRPLPYPEADRLVAVEFPGSNGPSPRDLQRIDWTGLRNSADLVVASNIDVFTVIGAGAPFSADGRWMTADAFAAFGVVPAAGRLFTAAEQSGNQPLALIGYQLWQERYAGRASAIGQSITIRATLRQGRAEPYTIVGVLPPKFWHLEDRTSLILPLKGSTAPLALRLRNGVAIADVEAQLTAIVRAQVPGLGPQWTAVVRSVQDAHVDRIRPMLAATGWSVLLLGAVAAANLAFLQMARGVARQREVAVRSVLGASGRDLMRATLSDGAAMGAGAAAVALVTSSLLLRGGVPAIERYFGRIVPGGAGGLGSDPVIIAATIVISLVASLLLALISLAASRTISPRAALAGNPSSTDTPARAISRQLITGTQVAVAFCLLVGAALMIRTAWHLGRVELGFEAAHVLSANVTLHESNYPSLTLRRQFFAELAERLEQLPNISHAGLTDWLPFRVGPVFSIEPEGAAAVASIGASLQGVNPAYFHALQITAIDGRLLTPEDRADRPRVAVISQSLAHSLWRAESPVDKTFRIRFSSAEPERPGFGPFRVVGVVEDHLRSLVDATPPQVYMPFDQQPIAANAFLQLKTTAPPLEAVPAVRRVLADADPTIPLASVTSLEALVDGEGMRPRFLARVLVAMALLAVSIAAIGLYAVSSWIAQQRQREAALRVALGAERSSVALLLAKRGFAAVGGGLVIGWIAAAPLARLMASELHGVDASDLSTRVAVAAMMIAIAGLALWSPAWRAATLNLSELLRSE